MTKRLLPPVALAALLSACGTPDGAPAFDLPAAVPLAFLEGRLAPGTPLPETVGYVQDPETAPFSPPLPSGRAPVQTDGSFRLPLPLPVADRFLSRSFLQTGNRRCTDTVTDSDPTARFYRYDPRLGTVDGNGAFRSFTTRRSTGEGSEDYALVYATAPVRISGVRHCRDIVPVELPTTPSIPRDSTDLFALNFAAGWNLMRSSYGPPSTMSYVSVPPGNATVTWSPSWF